MKTIHFSCAINKSVSVVWSMLSTKQGIEKFFSPNTDIVFETGGRFEIYFDMAMEKGLRGSEGMQILCFEPENRLGFTWNAPPSIMSLRGQHTAVFIELSELEKDKTKVSFSHCGFGEDKDWVQLYAYFVRAWHQLVLPRLIYACEMGSSAFFEDVDLTPYVERIV